jgi:hypothetical protein
MVDKTAKPSVASLIAGLAGVFKAIPSDKLEDIKDVVDMFNDGGEHTNPTGGEIVTGPAQRMSGDGAPKMISEYSHVAPQQGLTEQYAQFQRMLEGWGKSFLAQMSRHDATLNGIVGVFTELQKAQADAAAAAPAAPGADTFLGKSLLKLAKAKSALRKADLADADEADLRKSSLELAAEMLKSAKRLLAKASEEMEDTAAEEGCEKAMADLRALSKALAKAEDEDKEAEAAKKALVAKSEEEAKKKIEEAKEAGEKEKEAEKEAAATAKAKEIADAVAKAMEGYQADVKKALEGHALLTNTVHQVLDTVAGKSQAPGGAPAITKGVVVDVDFAKRVDQAIDENRLSDEGITRAQSLVQHMHLAKAGRIDIKVVEQEIDKSPAEVRDLFRPAA